MSNFYEILQNLHFSREKYYVKQNLKSPKNPNHFLPNDDKQQVSMKSIMI